MFLRTDSDELDPSRPSEALAFETVAQRPYGPTFERMGRAGSSHFFVTADAGGVHLVVISNGCSLGVRLSQTEAFAIAPELIAAAKYVTSSQKDVA